MYTVKIVKNMASTEKVLRDRGIWKRQSVLA